MANYTAIGQVSETLITQLQSAVAERDDVISIDRTEIVLSSPDDVGADSDVRLSLYLYKIEPTERQETATVTHDDVRKGRPLSLSLYYLLTAYPSMSGGNESTNMCDQHNVIGLAMQILHDNSHLNAADLGRSFDQETQITVTMESNSGNDVSRVWDSFRDVPRYPSVTYKVSPVHIDSLREEEIQRVTEREIS